MPAEHLRQLIARERPGVTAAQLCREAGVPANRLAHWLKPGTELVRMPTKDQLLDIARIIGCRVELVYHAFRLDVGIDIDVDLPCDERAVLASYRHLDESNRARARRLLAALGDED